MRTTKIKIKNLFGIREMELGEKILSWSEKKARAKRL